MVLIPTISTSQRRPFFVIFNPSILALSPNTISRFPFRRYYRFLLFSKLNMTAMEKMIYLHRHPIKNLLLVTCPDLVLPGKQVNEFSHR